MSELRKLTLIEEKEQPNASSFTYLFKDLENKLYEWNTTKKRYFNKNDSCQLSFTKGKTKDGMTSIKNVKTFR